MKILIVDDEQVIRESIAAVLPWEKYGYTVLSPAKSGEEALERIPLEYPDIIITDIMMPGISGLELIEALEKVIYPKEVIILSGYDDFDLVQEALRKNASDYLLKTSSPDDILMSVNRAKVRLEEVKQSKQKNIQHEYNRLIKKVIFQSYRKEDIVELEKVMNYQEKEAYQLILMNQVLPEDLFIQGEQAWNTYIFGNFIIHQEQTLILLKRIADLSDYYSFQLAKRKLIQLYNTPLFISDTFTSLPELPAQYEQMKSYIPFQELEMESSYITPSLIAKRTGISHLERFQEEEEKCIKLLKEGSRDQIQHWVEQLINWLFSHPNGTPKSIENYVHHLYFSIVRYFEQLYEHELLPGRKTITTKQLFSQPIVHVTTIFSELQMVVQSEQRSHPNYVKEAILYIERNLHTSITLQNVASVVHLHPNYLSDMLRKECGQTFLEIVTEKRMEKAAELLVSSDRHVQEIALAVGYHDRKYFTQLFKRYYTYTPTQYRKKTLHTL